MTHLKHSRDLRYVYNRTAHYNTTAEIDDIMEACAKQVRELVDEGVEAICL